MLDGPVGGIVDFAGFAVVRGRESRLVGRERVAGVQSRVLLGFVREGVGGTRRAGLSVVLDSGQARFLR